jgi:hypothetical protein
VQDHEPGRGDGREHGLSTYRTKQGDKHARIAVVGWAFMSSAWFLAGALDEERESSGDELGGPTRRAVIRHRMRLAVQRSAVAPALANLAEQVLAATEQRWGDRRLDNAPAFR